MRKAWKMCNTINCFEHFFFFVSAVTSCVSISASGSLVGVLIVGITSSALGLKYYAVTAGIKKYKPIIMKKRKKHDHIVLLAKTKLNSIEVCISKALIDSYINHD